MQRIVSLAVLIALACVLAGCGRSGAAPRFEGGATAGPAPTSGLTQLGASAGPAPAPSAAPATSGPQITIRADGQAQPIDPRILGVNLPAWLGPERLRGAALRSRTAALGSPLLRLPGGSWSNSYDWLACENGDPQGCHWTWAARPSDFLAFARATGQEPMWTVSINGTAQEAAALVAFFNGAVDDATAIGVDLRGRDWKTVGHWASLRAKNGSPEPLPIRLWEVGNEVYGGTPASGGSACASYGWEDVWTCDGAEYVAGRGEGAGRHEGYLEFRAAMRAVDPSILVGAVGVADPGGWSRWGDKVIATAGADLDFYIVHLYAYDRPPPSAEAVLASPQQLWPTMVAAVNAAFDTYAGGRRVPIAVTEYNLVAFQDLDGGQLMRRAVNALFLADSIGQMAQHGVAMANVWGFANGRAPNGTDYGLVDSDTGLPNPQYYALALWSRFGGEMLPLESTFAPATTLSAYAGRAADGTVTLLAINKTGRPLDAQLRVVGAPGSGRASVDVLQAAALDALDVQLNGVANPSSDLTNAPPRAIDVADGALRYTFAPFSITLIRFAPAP